MSSDPSPAQGSVGKGDDQKLPQTPYSDTFTALEEPEDELQQEPHDPWAEEDEGQTLGERLDIWRRKYLPLPDEVVYEFLGEDEYVVHSDHPSFRAFLEQNIAFVVLIPVIGPVLVWLFIARRGGDIDIHWGAVVAIFLLLDLIVAALALRRLGDRYTSYVITNLRLIKVTGIISRKLASIPWTRMTGLGYKQKAMGRLLGYATIFIESANEESGLREFSDVNDPQTFHQRLLDMVSAKSGQSNRPPPSPTIGKRQGLLAKHKERKKAAASDAPPPRVTAKRTAAASGSPSGAAGAATARPKVGGGPVKGRPKVPGSLKGSAMAEGSSAPDDRPRGPEESELAETEADGPPPEESATEPAAEDHGTTASTQPSGERRAWLRWPGTRPDASPPVPPPAGAPSGPSTGTGEPPKRRGPAQRAPSRRPPRTIVVPRSQQPSGPGQSRRGQRGRAHPRWKGRVREIRGYDQ